MVKVTEFDQIERKTAAFCSRPALTSKRTGVELLAHTLPLSRYLFLMLCGVLLCPAITTAATVEESDAMALAASKRGDFATVLRIVRPLAETGHAKSQQRLGYLNETGSGVPKDNLEAMKWYKLAAAQGLPAAQYSVGNMYDSGTGVSRNYSEALKWYRLAANQSYAMAQFHLGMMYQDGTGVQANKFEAFKWFELAAAQGNVKAESNIGVMYYEGLGVRQDNAKALYWYRLAAQHGSAKAQGNLGALYFNGRIVQQDLVRAYMWTSLSARTGAAEELKKRDEAASHLTGQQTRQAEQLAEGCLARSFQGCD